MTLRPRDKSVLAAIGALAVLTLLYFAVIAPVRHTAAGLSTSIASTEQSIGQDQSTYAAGRAAEAELKHDRAQWIALGRAVPATSNIPALLGIIQHEAAAVDVKVQTIGLSGSSSATTSAAPATTSTTPAASTAAGATSSASGSASTGQATAVPVSLTLSGSYAGIDRLIGRLDGLVEVSGGRVRARGPLLSISSVNLSGGGQKLTAQLSASIYQLNAAATSPGASS